MDAEEHTERIIQLINILVASEKVSPDDKHFVLDEFAGKLIGQHGIAVTQARCRLADYKYDRHTKARHKLYAQIDVEKIKRRIENPYYV